MALHLTRGIWEGPRTRTGENRGTFLLCGEILYICPNKIIKKHMELTHWFYGLADCHGIESFVHDIDDTSAALFFNDDDKKEKNSKQFAMCLRAQANQQRHAVVYRAAIPQSQIDVIESLIKAGDYTSALNEVKSCSKEIMLGTYGTTKSAAEKNWKMIPNADLDPYYTK
jgi:hypothetical protein